MADNSVNSQSHKTQKPQEEIPHHVLKNQSKLNFLHKSALLAAFLVLLPLIPSQAPDFINQTLHSRSWELLQLVIVGIAVSYGLFSKRNDDSSTDHSSDDNSKDYSSSKFDNAQSYVSKLLQVSSVFDDESEDPIALIDEDNKVETWSSRYYREKPVVMVAKENPALKDEGEDTVVSSGVIGHNRPLLLPVRSLKERVSEPEDEVGAVHGAVDRRSSFMRSSSSSRRFTSSSTDARKRGIIDESGGLNSQKMEENFNVLRSPVPWRSRSGRLMEMKESGDGPPSSTVEKESAFVGSMRSFRSSDSNLSPKRLSPSPSVSYRDTNLSPSTCISSSESRSKLISEDLITKKTKLISSSSPPPPPPPPPFIRKPMLAKSSPSSTVLHNAVTSSKGEFKRSVRSVPDQEEMLEIKPDNEESSKRTSPQSDSRASSVRTFRTTEPTFTIESMRKSVDEEKDVVMEKVLMETTDEDSETEHDDDEVDDKNDSLKGISGDKVEAKNDDGSVNSDVGPDVDKKADEFIAKFREQIRLQRIESIRRSAAQRAGKAN